LEISGTVVASVGALLVGGLVKGVVGLGLPLVGMPLLTLVLDVKSAIGVLAVPLIVSNLSQSFEGGRFPATLRRFWPLLLTISVVEVASVGLLKTLSDRALYLFIGTSIIVIPLIAHFSPRLRIPPRYERWTGPAAGVFAGIVGGLSTFYGPPLMLYLIWLRMAKDEFVVAVSLTFFVGASALTVGLLLFGVADFGDIGLSVLACAPVFAGMWIGQKARVRLDQRRFSQLVLAVYVSMGLSFLARLF
jgi:uncharacterized membrane protein YfcA